MTPKVQELLGRIDRLAREANGLRLKIGHNLFERVKLASELLADPGYVQANGGPEPTRIKLEDTFFADLLSSISLHRLVVAACEFPEVAEWERRGFDLERITNAAAHQRNAREAKPAERRPTKGQLLAAKATAERATADKFAFEEQLEAKKVEVETLAQKADRLERELSAAKAEIDQLKAEVADLKKKLVRRRSSDTA